MPNIHRIDQHAKIVQLLAPQAINDTDVDGTEIDTTGYDALLVIANVGDIPTGGDVDVKVQTGASAYTDITGAIHEGLAPAGDDEVYLINVDLNALPDRTVSVNVANAAAVDAVVGVIGILYSGMSAPPAQENTVIAV